MDLNPVGSARSPRLLYLHGFRSSPASFKARLLADRMTRLGRSADFFCPALPVSPMLAVRGILEDFAPRPQDILIGSSLGGFYATWLAERSGARAVLLNPAVAPASGLRAYVGQHKNFHDEGSFRFEEHYLDELRALDVPMITFARRYFLIAATGDELLDWRQMARHYPGARQHIIEGSDHSLSDFADYMDEVLAFAGVETGKKE